MTDLCGLLITESGFNITTELGDFLVAECFGPQIAARYVRGGTAHIFQLGAGWIFNECGIKAYNVQHLIDAAKRLGFDRVEID